MRPVLRNFDCLEIWDPQTLADFKALSWHIQGLLYLHTGNILPSLKLSVCIHQTSQYYGNTHRKIIIWLSVYFKINSEHLISTNSKFLLFPPLC